MAAPHRDSDHDNRPTSPRIVAGKPFEVVDGRLVKLGPEQWELDGEPWPGLDDHILEPDQPWQLVDGELIPVVAKDPHARAHLNLCALLAAHLIAGYEGLCDAQTRFGVGDDFAPDGSVLALYDTDGESRPVEVLAFEICSAQRLSVNTKKARAMVRRGVRRVFCLELRRDRVLEWDAAREDWRELAVDDAIEDPCLATALPVAALLDASQRDAAVVRALRSRRVPELDEIFDEGYDEGHEKGFDEGRRQTLLRLVVDHVDASELEVLRELEDIDVLETRILDLLAGRR